MTDREIWEQIINLMQEGLERDEWQLKHVKLLHRRMEAQQELLGSVLELTRLPAGPERDALSLRIEQSVLGGGLQREARRLVAAHESQHERTGGILARFREELEGLE
jgi:hypothetical protein